MKEKKKKKSTVSSRVVYGIKIEIIVRKKLERMLKNCENKLERIKQGLIGPDRRWR